MKIQKQNVIIVDLDGTICPIKTSDERYEDLIPYQSILDKLQEFKQLGWKIIINTARNMNTFDGDIDQIHKITAPMTHKWLKRWNVPYDEIVFGKQWPGSNGFYVDDKAIRPIEFLEHSIEEINTIIAVSKDKLSKKIGKSEIVNIIVNEFIC